MRSATDASARLALQAGLWLLVYAAAFILVRRIFLAAGFVIAFQVVVLAVDAAKRRFLREPLVYADLALFSQLFRHPNLYLPYFGWGRAAALTALGLAALAFGLAFESPVGTVAAALPMVVVAALLLALGTGIAPPLSLDAGRDAARFGLLGAMWLQALAERKPLPRPAARLAVAAAAEKPPIVVVQSESFFDARRLGADVDPGVLARFDALCAEGASGRLDVPVWGAYTMRTEFAFLSALPSEALGVHQHNPYRRFARAGVATIASALRAAGYRTVCVHPYAARFFGRERVFPRLGFDEFIDIAGFAGADRDGAYVSDAAVAAKVGDLLRGSRAPLFVFAITMENHGPLPEGDAGFAEYLRHLANADRMCAVLAEVLRPARGVLCLYGDHVPGLPALYRARGYDDRRTDYLVWRAGSGARRTDLAAHELAFTVLERAGLSTTRA